VTDEPKPPGEALPSGTEVPRRTRRQRAAGPDAAFDLWLDGGLRAIYDGVAKEPLPPELLAMLQDPKEKS
jgi:hypothetical protein